MLSIQEEPSKYLTILYLVVLADWKYIACIYYIIYVLYCIYTTLCIYYIIYVLYCIYTTLCIYYIIYVLYCIYTILCIYYIIYVLYCIYTILCIYYIAYIIMIYCVYIIVHILLYCIYSIDNISYCILYITLRIWLRQQKVRIKNILENLRYFKVLWLKCLPSAISKFITSAPLNLLYYSWRFIGNQ